MVTRGVPPAPALCVFWWREDREALWGGPADDLKRGFESGSARKMSEFWAESS